MQLTLINRLKICFEVLTIRSGHKHPASEKQLSTFLHGYSYGFDDGEIYEREHGHKYKINIEEFTLPPVNLPVLGRAK